MPRAQASPTDEAAEIASELQVLLAETAAWRQYYRRLDSAVIQEVAQRVHKDKRDERNQIRHMGRLAVESAPLAFAGSIGLWVIVVLLMMAVFNIPIGSALFGGVIVVVLHWFCETVHQLGHAWAARRTGYPMTGMRFGTGRS